MAVLSVRGRRKFADVTLIGFIIVLAWLLQLTILNNFTFQNIFCNLPLTLTILWGFVTGTPLSAITADDLRSRSTVDIFFHQLASGSITGFLIGAFVAALYSSVLPIYPLCYPLIGWIAGYFDARNFSRETLLCIPVVLIATILAELITALQLWVVAQLGLSPHFFEGGTVAQAWQFLTIGQSEPFLRLAQMCFPEALLNALIAPFVYFPLSSWYAFFRSNQITD